MKKIWGITFGGLHNKILAVMLVFLLAVVGFNTAVSMYKTVTLRKIVEESGKEQQEAIQKVSGDTVYKSLEESITKMSALRAAKLDDEFTEIENNIRMLQDMATNLFENADSLEPASVPLPDPENTDKLEIHLLFEEGVDYQNSEYVGIAGHMSDTMLSLVAANEKVDGCYIGLADGTHIGISSSGADKYDENGKQKPFPVRHRPWYVGAVEKGDVFFTGVERDAFNGSMNITCAAPVTVNGKTVAVVGADIVFDQIDEFVSDSESSSEFAFLLNDEGQIIAIPENNGLFRLEDSGTAEDLRDSKNKELAGFITKALKEKTGLETISINGKEYYMSSTPMDKIGWAVVTVIDKDATNSLTNNLISEIDRINSDSTSSFREGAGTLSRLTVIGIVSIILIGSVYALLVANKIVKPIESMTSDIIEGSKTGKLFEMKDLYRTGDEIEVLAESFDNLSQETKRYIDNLTSITKEKERMNTELSLATQIQAAMLPHVFPPFPERTEFDIYATMNPAREVGGDFYDFFLIDDDHLCMVMADVSGKGIPAALYMMISMALLKSSAMLSVSPSEVLTKTNEILCSGNSAEMFVTVWLGILEISTGKLTASNAGHEYPAIKHRDGSFELFKDKHGFVLGGMDISRYKDYTIDIAPGDKLFLYTDGVPEATDAYEKMFGTDRMLEALNKDENASPQKILENVENAVDEFVMDAEQFDDLTMLCIEYRGKDNKN